MSVKDCLDQIGTTYPPSPWITITQDMIDTFADVTGDQQFIHTDPERAAETPFGGTIAHGFLTVSMLSNMSIQVVPVPDDCKMTVNYGANRLRFLSPVPSGARIRGHVTQSNAEETAPGEVTLTWEVRIEIEGQEKPALFAEWLVRRYF